MRNFAILLCFIAIQAHSQIGVLNNNPPAIKWQQVNTPSIRVIYPRGVEAEAQRVANTLEHIRLAESRTLGKAPRKISVILQNQSSISNAFVSIAPRRSEFFMMPSQNYNFLGSNDWLNLLAVHEYRHVVQFENAITGFNKLFYYAFGPATTAAMANVAVPSWFWEGDAVALETGLTKSGRGRIPNFNMNFRTNLLEGRTFNYDKQYLRSYKHFIPDHYVLGYHMVSYLRERSNDPEIWGKITKRAWNVPFLPFRFSNSIHKYADIRVSKLYKEMANEYKTRWENKLKELSLTSFETVNKRKSKAFTNYHYPNLLDDGSVIAMKSGIGDVDHLVLIKDGVETRIHTQGVVNDGGMLSTANTKVVWNEYEFDPRYRVKTYSVIKAYDVATKQLWKLSSKSRYGAAALSPDGYQVVTVETNTGYQTTVVIIDFFSKQEKKRFENAENHFYAMPRFSNDGKSVVVTKTTPQGKTISTIDVASGLERDILPVTNENIGHPVLEGDILYFNSPVSGIDNIYAYDLKTEKRYQVTSSKYGAFNPALSADGKTLFYNDQGRDGLDVVKMPVDPVLWKEVSFTKPVKTFFEFLAEQEGRPNLLDSIPQIELSTKRYSKLSGIINPVSWGAYFDSNLTSTTLGITSRNILSTTAVSAGYDYNIAENSGSWNTTLSYQAWLPIVDISASFANRSVNEGDVQIRVIERNPTPPQDTTRNELIKRNLTLDWEERNVSVGLRIPLLLTRSKYNSGLTISNNIGYTKVSSFTNSLYQDARFAPAETLNDTITRVYTLRNYVGNNNLVFNRFRVNAFRYFRQSSRDFLPRWGQTINLDWYKSGFGSDLNGSLFAFYSQLFFPGLFKHHSFNGYWAYQRTLYTDDFRTNYVFSNRIPVPRGQSIFRAQQFYSMSANYALPLWYPDVNIGPLVNFQRLRLNAFVDYGFANSPSFDSSQSYLTVGTEVKLDMNILRFVPQLDIGFRVSYGLRPSVSTFEFLLGTINF
ncbi:hypothetical protein SanaruYs_01080 [Chryseotalea sanaruensis]|uniref:Uncharacterized protein n=1 Tax=Chryseotalea sanaruensis TaxID=2482724 RepID=A0A401U4J4_9BACT|nr:PD40 domain-containing protein [Chryseotalea sanaruensis]GCC49894.1 hypothetical protein SanaruYs_01080 [Chryseotalea sanaruensis]